MPFKTKGHDFEVGKIIEPMQAEVLSIQAGKNPSNDIVRVRFACCGNVKQYKVKDIRKRQEKVLYPHLCPSCAAKGPKEPRPKTHVDFAHPPTWPIPDGSNPQKLSYYHDQSNHPNR